MAAFELETRQAPAAFICDSEERALTQPLTHAAHIDAQKLGSFGRREAIFQQRHILSLALNDGVVFRPQGWLVSQGANTAQRLRFRRREISGGPSICRGSRGQWAIARERGSSGGIPLGQRALLRRCAVRQLVRTLGGKSRGSLHHAS